MMRESKMKYGVVAVVMLVGMLFIVAMLESVPVLGLFGMAILFFTCSAVLLFCLMKLGVMDFQEGSFWDTLNQQVNMPAQHRYVSAGKTVGKMILTE